MLLTNVKAPGPLVVNNIWNFAILNTMCQIFHHQFEPATADEVKKLFLSSQDKSCDLKALPTKVLQSCIYVLLTRITNIVNLSLESSVI